MISMQSEWKWTLTCWQLLYSMIINDADKHCPMIKMDVRLSIEEYLNNECLDLMQDRDYFVQKYENTKDAGDGFIAWSDQKSGRPNRDTKIQRSAGAYYPRSSQ